MRYINNNSAEIAALPLILAQVLYPDNIIELTFRSQGINCANSIDSWVNSCNNIREYCIKHQS